MQGRLRGSRLLRKRDSFSCVSLCKYHAMVWSIAHEVRPSPRHRAHQGRSSCLPMLISFGIFCSVLVGLRRRIERASGFNGNGCMLLLCVRVSFGGIERVVANEFYVCAGALFTPTTSIFIPLVHVAIIVMSSGSKNTDPKSSSQLQRVPIIYSH